MKKLTAVCACAALSLFAAHAVESGPQGTITFHSAAYSQVGDANSIGLLLGCSDPDTAGDYVITDANGTQAVPIGHAVFDNDTQSWRGSWISVSVPQTGVITVTGDMSLIDVLIFDGAYVTEVEMPGCTNLEILSLEHNALQSLDLTAFTKLQALYLTDNPFTQETPLVVGANKPELQILELDIIDWLDQSFNLSDYPALVTFDGYHNMSLYNVDPSGCPELRVLSVEMAPVSTLDVTQNPKLMRLNIAETRITDIDLTQSPNLQMLIASHVSGSINTEYRLNSLDVSQNPLLGILHINGNQLGAVDLSNNPLLTNLTADRNALTSIDLSANTQLYSVSIQYNDMDFATLPKPEMSWGEYFYRQNPMEVPRAIKLGTPLDLSARVLREGTETSAYVMRTGYGFEDEPVPANAYTYSNGIVTFTEAPADSVYVVYTNSDFEAYNMRTTTFKVKSAESFGQPSRILTMTPAKYSEPIQFSAGMAGATPGTPKTLLVDFGNGTRQEFTADFALEPGVANVTGIPSGTVSIYIPEGEVLTSFAINGTPLSALNVKAATELGRLTVNDCALPEINLTYNRCLTDLDLSGNVLRTLDLSGGGIGDYEKNVLANFRAADNNLSQVTVVSTTQMQTLDLSGNKLEEFPLKDYDALKQLNLSDNLLTEANLAYLVSATEIDLSGNLLTSVTPCPDNAKANLDLSDNTLDFTTLPLPSTQKGNYVYAPQKEIAIPEKAPVVNLSEQTAPVELTRTGISWYKEDGTPLAEGSDYSINNGITSFLKGDLGVVYAVLSNQLFPDLSGANALKTTPTLVIPRPTDVVASFKTIELNGTDPRVIFAASEEMQLYADWNGDGSMLEPYDVYTTYKAYSVPTVKHGAQAKLYACSPEDAAKITVFSIYDIKMLNVDLSPLTGCWSLNLGNTSLRPQDLTLPESNGLGELHLDGNRFEEYPYQGRFPNLYSLNLSRNLLTSFDGSQVPSLGYLSLSGNQISDVTFNNPDLWSIQLDNNKLESIDLNGLPALEQIILNANLLSEIDITPVSGTLNALTLVGNNFTFATLPLQSDYPNLQVFYYGNQAPISPEVDGLAVDLSSQAVCGGVATEYAWYRGIPEYNEETGELDGDLLTEGTDYTISDGTTTFLQEPGQPVLCVMTNENWPNLLLITNLIQVSGVEEFDADGEGQVRVYSLQGHLLRQGTGKEALKALPSGIYIVNGKKIRI